MIHAVRRTTLALVLAAGLAAPFAARAADDPDLIFRNGFD